MIKIFDGAMGTMLQQAGIAPVCPEYACLSHPEIIIDIHKQYINAGANIIETNTFGASPLKLTEFALAEQTERINAEAVKVAKIAAGDKVQVAGSVGPLGQLMAPLGELGFDYAVECYARQIKALAGAGVDYILLETIIDIQEMRAALIAAKGVCNLPIICQMSMEADARTVTGTDAATMAAILQSLGASVLGLNCSLGPAQLLPIIRELAKCSSLPLSVQANAGMPQLIDGKTVFPLSPDAMALFVPQMVEAGASFIGGCCGTTPDHIAAIAKAAQGLEPTVRIAPDKVLRLASRTKVVEIGINQETVLIGERINPTGRKQMAQELREGNLSMVKREALEQVQAGAKVLDVNMGVAGLQQAELMSRAVAELSMLVDVPLCIDSTDPEVIEAGLRYFPGRALINSVSDNPNTKTKILELAKKYGAAVIILPLTEKELPKTADERMKIAESLIAEAKAIGLSDTDIMIDALVLTVATDAMAASEVLKTLQGYKAWGYPSTMGLSNISFGLPQREKLNLTFYVMCLAKGLCAPIINPKLPELAELSAAAQVILGRDAQGLKYSQSATTQVSVTKVAVEEITADNVLLLLRECVVCGEKERAVQLTDKAIQLNCTPVDITNDALISGLMVIGEKFAAKKAFLPQVLLSAETMRSAFDNLKKHIAHGEELDSCGKVILATVAGDIHDLGKNIVAALLGNSGFEVIDLGKDVAPQEILAATREHKPHIIGLCALMTTTLPAMQESVELLQADGVEAKIMVGGAVVTAEYATSINADYYAADAVQALNLAREICSK